MQNFAPWGFSAEQFWQGIDLVQRVLDLTTATGQRTTCGYSPESGVRKSRWSWLATGEPLSSHPFDDTCPILNGVFMSEAKLDRPLTISRVPQHPQLVA